MSLTKEQRHEAYKLALIILKDEIARGQNTFICPNLSDISLGNFDHPYAYVKYDFPEFYVQKPDNVNYDDGWWPVTDEGNQQRIQVLENCIELTK